MTKEAHCHPEPLSQCADPHYGLLFVNAFPAGYKEMVDWPPDVERPQRPGCV